MDIIADWFEEATRLKSGESILIPVISKAEALRIAKAFNKQKAAVMKIAPEKAYLINVRWTFKQEETQHYIVLEKTAYSPFTAFKKGPGGTSVVTLSTKEAERERRRTLMMRDGIPFDEIQALEKAEDEKDLKDYVPEEE